MSRHLAAPTPETLDAEEAAQTTGDSEVSALSYARHRKFPLFAIECRLCRVAAKRKRP